MLIVDVSDVRLRISVNQEKPQRARDSAFLVDPVRLFSSRRERLHWEG